jgi:hypothetical protein
MANEREDRDDAQGVYAQDAAGFERRLGEDGCGIADEAERRLEPHEPKGLRRLLAKYASRLYSPALAAEEAAAGPGLPDGELSAALAEGLKRVERALNELRVRFDWSLAPFGAPWRKGTPAFHFSPAAAPLLGLGVALEAVLRELRGDAQGRSLDLEVGQALRIARDQLMRLSADGYVSPVRFISRLDAEGARFDGPRGREAVEQWWRASGLVLSVYQDVCNAMMRELRDEVAARVVAGREELGSGLSEGCLLDQGRLAVPMAGSVDEWLTGGYLRLLGLHYGLSVLRGGGSRRDVGVGVVDLVRVFSVGRAPLGA